jgi:nitroreductase
MRRDAVAENFLALVCSRRSVAPKRLVEPGPCRADLETIVGAACSAPDHGGLQPFRVILVAEGSHPLLGEIFVEAKRRRLPDASSLMLDRERQKALNAPTLLVACARLHDGMADIPVSEQLVSVGAAIQNLLLAAHALGFGAILLSGEKTRDPLVRDAFGLGSDEMLVGFISIGTPDPSHHPLKHRRAVEAYLSTWTEPPWQVTSKR